MSSPKLGLVTVLYNAPDVLPDFFESLAVQEYKNFQLYVVDNSSQPEPLALARALAAQHGIVTTFIDNEGNNVGVAAGNNQGIKIALRDKCENVLLINNDLVFLKSNIFSNLMTTVDSGENIVSPLILSHPEGLVWYAGGYFDDIRALAPHVFAGREINDVNDPRSYFPYAPTCFLIINREVFEKIGLMDEKYFAYYDDTDFLYRAYRALYRVKLVRNVVISHKVSSSTGGDVSYFGAYHLTRNRIYYAKKNIPSPLKQVSVIYTLVSRLVKMPFVKSIVRQGFINGLIDGFKM